MNSHAQLPTVSFKEVKQYLRNQEADNNILPSSIQKQLDKEGNESWTISFDKLVIYQNDNDQTEAHAYQAKDALNCNLHADALKAGIKSKLSKNNSISDEDNSSLDIDVQVKRKYKTFLGIPLKSPFSDQGFERGPNKVRGDRAKNLATQATRVSVTIGNVNKFSTDDKIKLWDALNEAACFHTHNDLKRDAEDGEYKPQILATGISSRQTYNPLRWLGRLFSYCVPRSLASVFPSSLRAMARTKPYGYGKHNSKLDYPVFNSGLAADATNTGIALALGLVVAAIASFMIYLGFKSSKNENRNPVSSTTGFLFGTFSQPSLGGSLVAGVLANNNGGHGDVAAMAQGYRRAMFIQSGVGLLTSSVGHVANSNFHMPFATRTKICSR